ncbi:GNAT family N-acetyltransferase [Phyllobacterium sp. 628]|uniref:GNAT family N-acetyltransferase n=1 Tax=Phyllobacterium sp. 628 TaxID=2718938 RepID=UPI0016626056|nr:GNAT family N-acetyltransferase [Phyllobacterium sp. 628]QND51182.1 GNAT family N-acetyltransferase [Phyllobacterium sp. 628]
MSHEKHIRTANAADLPALLELYRQLHPDDPVLPSDTALQIWQQFSAFHGSKIFLGFKETKLVATCTLVIIPNLTRFGSPYGLVENVVTDSAYQRLGYGRALLKTAIESAWECDCYKVMLLTGSKKPETIRFYAESGFEQSKTGFQMRRPATM